MRVQKRQPADLRMQRRQIRLLCRRHRTVAEHLGRPLEQLPFPVGDLVRMNVILLRQLGNRPIALCGRQCHFRLESG